MLAILNSSNSHNLPIFQPILMILVSQFMVHRDLSDKTYLLLGLLSPLTIGRNPTKFGVRNFHMSGLCDSTFLGPSPWGPGEGSKVNYHI